MNSLTATRSELTSQAPPDGRLGRGLGWFSLALGATEVAMPRTLAQLIGIEPDRRTSMILRALGAREIVAGLGVLTRPRQALPLWSRVAGDVIDLALLGVAARARSSTARLLGAIAAVAGVTALDVVAARRTRTTPATPPVIFSVTINKPPQDVYAFYRKLEQLPTFMEFLASVEQRGDTSHWVARLPIGGTVAWDATITEDRPGELIAWQSVPDSAIQTRGRVSFASAPGRDGRDGRNMTEVRVEMELGTPLTRASATLARLFTRSQVKGDLRRLKQVLETGEVLHSDASIHRGPHPAQPSAAGPDQPVTPGVFRPSPPTAEKGVTR